MVVDERVTVVGLERLAQAVISSDLDNRCNIVVVASDSSSDLCVALNRFIIALNRFIIVYKFFLL